MEFILKQQAILILIKKYNVKKNFIRKVEKKVNMIGIVKNHIDYFNLIDAIISTYTCVMTAHKAFTETKDNLIVGVSLDYIIEYELKRKFGINMEKYINKRLIKR